eukprot:gene9187-1274_t
MNKEDETIHQVEEKQQENPNQQIKISKNQQKKLIRNEKYEKIFKEKKLKEKEERIKKKAEITKIEDEKISKMTEEEFEKYKKMKIENRNSDIQQRREFKKNKEERLEKIQSLPTSEVISVCIDCNFKDMMNEREYKSLAQQIMHIYARNCKEEIPFYLIVSGIGPTLQKVLDNLSGVEKWKIVKTSKTDFRELVDEKTECVYLSAESETKLETLEKGKCFIIGGLVDKNRHKGFCHEKAEKMKLKTAKFPIEDYLQLNSRSVLTTNQCFDILHEFKNTSSWESTFEKEIPERKRKMVKK